MEEKIFEMKDLVTSRRKIPEELWRQIFKQRVFEDEQEYEASDREERPPFTVLRLSWVCRVWREVVVGQRSLWQYIPIPYSHHISRRQHARIDYFRKRLRNHPAVVFMTRGRQEVPNTEFELKRLLKRFSSFQRLDLYVSPDDSIALNILDNQPVVQELILGYQWPDDEPLATFVLEVFWLNFVNVKSISCTHVLPQLTGGLSIGEDRSVHIDSAQFFLVSEVNALDILAFIHSASTTDVIIEAKFPLTICPVPPTLQWPYFCPITIISANLITLSSIFNEFVDISCMHTVNIQLDGATSSQEPLEQWRSFLAPQHRWDHISCLQITGLHPDLSKSIIAETCAGIIKELPKLNELVLEEAAIIPTLTTLDPVLPPLSKWLMVSKTDGVNTELVITYIPSFDDELTSPHSPQTEECALTPKQKKERLSQTLEMFIERGKKK
jgi:hypothetical protein